MTAVEWFVKGLQERGVEWAATLCGHGLDPFDRAAKKAGLRLVDTRNEQAAAYMAETHGRLTRRPGVVAVSSGVAHANAMTGVLNAYFDSAPLLLVSGAGPLTTAGMGHFQDVDQVALASPVTRYARVIDSAARTLHILDEAWAAASAFPPGPVHLTFPLDIQVTEVADTEMIRPVPHRASCASTPQDLERAAQFLARASRPLIVAGSGVYYAGESKALTDFSERFSVPITVPIWDRGSVDSRIETFMGVLGAATGGPGLLADADLILMAGAIADYRVGYLQPHAIHPDARVVRIDSGWKQLGAIYEQQYGKANKDWLTEASSRRDKFRKSVEKTAAEQSSKGLHAVHILHALRDAMPDNTVLLIDGGSIGQWAHQLLTDRYPGHWLTCGRSGVVGWGLGGAMGARSTYPGRPVVLLSGDGAFTFTVAEVECAVRQRLPFVAIVADDEGWGITRTGHLRSFGEAITSSLGPVDFVKLAEAFGAKGVRATAEPEIAAALKQALAEETVTVIHVPIVGGNP